MSLHPLFARLRQLAQDGPVVVAHRGASRDFPENTLPAFAAATELGAPVQEFDVRATADGELVCVHDDTYDRTTDSAKVLGPGALVAGLRRAEVGQLDAGAWKGARHAGARVPSLAEAIATMLPRSAPMLEHKAGEPARYVAELRRLGALPHVLVQSFDWEFVRAMRALEPAIALGALGPTAQAGSLDAAVLDEIAALGAGFVHWAAREVRAEDVEAAHARGLLVCTYTTDDDAGLCGGAALGFDLMCTNDPARMLELRRRGLLRRRP